MSSPEVVTAAAGGVARMRQLAMREAPIRPGGADSYPAALINCPAPVTRLDHSALQRYYKRGRKNKVSKVGIRYEFFLAAVLCHECH
jgi:hypothetical protein